MLVAADNQLNAPKNARMSFFCSRVDGPLGTEKRLKNFNRPLTFRSIINFLGSLFLGHPTLIFSKTVPS